MRIHSPAKLNWTLEILGRRADGFHEIRSWLVAIGLYDSLSFAAQNATSTLTISGPMAEGIPSDRRNLILKADALWRKAGGVAPFAAWGLEKYIPAAGGLGGGSGNAAAALLLLQKHSTTQPTQSLEQLALSLGSDVPFFLQQQSAILMGGQGEQVLATAEAPELFIVLAIPFISVPTPGVFRNLDAPDFDRNAENNSEVDLSFPAEPGVNGLLSAAIIAAPKLALFESDLSKVARFHLSGSGGTFFCIAEDPQSAANIAAEVDHLCQHSCVVPLLRGPVIAEILPEK
ncbi:MAG: hypothetical protein O3A95_05085 [Planctomycetota bacterium]|nr:hypothetical protein [Planctomycetota bacterium]MDA1113659.1 hypothetical protein [Planctomycetota bacterium]